MNSTPTDQERYPTLTEQGRQILQLMTEHPCAPVFRNHSGNRLTAEDVERVRAFEKLALASDLTWGPQQKPAWLDEFVQRCLAEVPHYRAYAPSSFENLPVISRADLSRDIAAFVPDPVEIDRLINFRTSGTTGHPLLLASHPQVAACYLAFHKKALRRFGIELRHGRRQVGVVLVGFQRKCFTYVSVTPTMDDSGLAKINLHLNDWKSADDRAKYLDALATEVYTGDPISLAELATLPLKTKPRAILSTSMALSKGLRKRLEETFNCPVLDLYSLNEAGPIAVYDESSGGHALLQHCMYVEILDEQDRPVAPGVRGQITLTGGFNFCLPLLRYKTGDYAALHFHKGDAVLQGLEGRPPVTFRTQTGERINNIEVTHALQRLALPQFALHQDRTGALHMRIAGNLAQETDVRESLLQLFGPAQPLTITTLPPASEKIVQYTSDLQEQDA